MKTTWDDVKSWLSDATKVAIKEAEDLTRKGRLKIEILTTSRRLEKKLAELGSFVYEAFKRTEISDLAQNEKVQQYRKEIQKLEQELKRKKKGLKKTTNK